MTPERFRQVRNVFEAALERPPEERSAFVVDAAHSDLGLAAHVKRMLDAHANTVTFLDGGLAAPEELRTDPRRLEGRRLGVYEILREIGRGGMGTVYLARRADGLFEQQVAIKVVTPESAAREVIERFGQERSILASLEHPNIARLYDGGSTDEGWPYFVMEFVDGRPIDEWCDAHKLNVSERVELFRKVCAAVQYALQRRVIHRDLKPGNILVTEDGTVKLLDFGIAKLVRLDSEEKTALATRTGIRMMTPEYASPEQIRAEEVTPLTDLYSLGVILYELLTGRRPYRLKSRVFHEIVRVVCEVPATRPSSVVTEVEERPGNEGKTVTIAPGLFSQSREGTPLDLKRRLTGDLDGILLKALVKDPRERYRSVEQFSADLERHLLGEPVLAAKAGRLAEVSQRASKYRWPIVVAAGVLLALAIGGIRVDVRGVAAVAGIMAAFGLWHVATDRELGAKLSESKFRSGAFLLVVCTILAGIVIQVARYFVPGWTGGEVAGWVGTAAVLLAALYLIALMCAWMVRERWAGSLVSSIKTVDTSPWLVPLNTLNSLLIMRDLLRHQEKDSSKVYLAVGLFVLILIAGIYSWTAARRLEVRDRGLLYWGRLISWLNIERYEWEDAPSELTSILARPNKVILRLRVSRLFSILPSPRIRIPSDDRAGLEAILNRHLSEWPQP